MSHKAARRISVATVAIALIVMAASLNTGSVQVAQADPPSSVLLPSSDYELNVPSSVFAAAGTSTSTMTAGETGAFLANQSLFDHDWQTNSSLAEISGNSADVTTAPTVASDGATLGLADESSLDFAVKGFVVPAVPAAPLATTSVGLSAGEALLASGVGVELGFAADRVVGIDVTKGLCDGGPDTSEDQFLAIITFSNCSQYIQNASKLPNDDQIAKAQPSTSCYETVCVSYLGAVGFAPYQATQACFLVPSQPAGGGNYGGIPGFARLILEMNMSDHDGQGARDDYSSSCQTAFGVAPSGYTMAGSYAYSDSDELLSWNVLPETVNYDPLDPSHPVPPTLETQDRANPERYFRCDILLSGAPTLTANTAEFTEGDDSVPALNCPPVGEGQTPTQVKVYEVIVDGTSRLVFDESTTSAYLSWSDLYEKCSTGSCLLDLLYQGTSCFTLPDSDCDGWINSTSGDFTCTYGSAVVANSECDIYGPTFNATNRGNGEAWGDPSTGATATKPVSPTAEQAVASALLGHRWLTAGRFSEVAELSDPDRRDIATAIAAGCLANLDAENDLLIIRLTPKQMCDETIYAPGSDILEATEHDAAAILTGKPSVIHYEGSSLKEAAGISHSWYVPAATNCAGEYIAKADSDDYTECDEYPFFSAIEGGPGVDGAPGSDLLNINNLPNRVQGYQLRTFYSASGCDRVASASKNDSNEYTVVPDPVFISVAICGG